MIKKNYILLIMLISLSCLFTGCKSEQNDTKNTEQTEVNSEQTKEEKDTEDTSLIGEANEKGNSIGNLNEYGLVARQGDWIYFFE